VGGVEYKVQGHFIPFEEKKFEFFSYGRKFLVKIHEKYLEK